jgi:protein SCO1
MRKFTSVFWRLVILTAFALSGCTAVSTRLVRTDDFGPAPEFALTERHGEIVRRQDLEGKVWVAAFIFTRCMGPCSQVSGTMARLQHDLADEADLRLVSFTVDPEFDTPAVLTAYAKRFQADPKRWLFLTGEAKTVYPLIREGFHLTAEPNTGADRTPGNEVMHDVRLVLVDRRGHVRLRDDVSGLGYFDATKTDEIPALEKKILALLRENP